MKLFAFLVAIVLFLGGLALFGYAFTFTDGWNTLAFVVGIAAVSVSLMIPFHIMGRADS
jgi:hypothetical protein